MEERISAVAISMVFAGRGIFCDVNMKSLSKVTA